MEEISKQCISPQAQLELTFSLSSKRQKTEHADINGRSGKSQSDFPPLQTFPRTISSLASEHSLQENGAAESTSEDSGFQLNVTLIPTELRDLPEQDFVMVEGNLLDVGKDDHLPVPVADKPSLSPGHDTDSNTSRPLRKSPEDENSARCNLPPGKDVGKIEKEGSEIDACSVTFQSDAVLVAATDESHELEHVEDNRSDKEGKYLTPPSDCAELKHNLSNPTSSEIVEMANSDSGLQIYGAKSLSGCNLETRDQVNEIESAELIPCVVENCEGILHLEDTAMETSASSELDDICFAKSEREAAGHTMPACTSQEPAEGDNDGGSIDVIGPAFQSVFDREAEEKCCNSSKTSSEEKLETHSSSSQCPYGLASEKVSSLQNHSRKLNEEMGGCCDENNNVGHPCTKLQESSELKEPTQSCPDSVGQVPVDAEDVDHSLWDSYEMDWVDCNKETDEEMARFIDEIESGENGTPEDPTESQEMLQYVEETMNDYVCDGTEPGKQNQDVQLKLVESEEENKIELPTMNVTSEKNSENEMRTTEEEIRSDNSVSQEKCEYDVEQANEFTADTTTMPAEHFSDPTNRQKSTLCFENDQEQNFPSFADYKDKLSALALPSSDAIVPSHCDFKQQAKAPKFTLYGCGLDGDETFEKIKLSPNDDDDDDDCDAIFNFIDINNIPVSTSSPRRQMQTPQQSIEEDEEIKEEETNNPMCQNENPVSSCDITELLNLMAPEDALDCPEIPPIFESTSESDINPQPELSANGIISASNISKNNEFGMKKEFDNVLKELNLFFEISRAAFSPSPPQQRDDVLETALGDASECKEEPCSPDKLHRGNITAEVADEEGHVLELCEEDPLLCPPTTISESEQEVPVSSILCQETSMETAETQRERSEMKQWEKTPSPSFASRPLLEQLSSRLPVQPRRLEPLKTCTRPIRVGLSKRAKTKQLHRCHPYK